MGAGHRAPPVRCVVIRVGVVGAAFAGNLHAEALCATGRAEIVGVVSATESSRTAFAERWGCRSYVDLASMIAAERLDVVTLAMPNRFHRDAVLEAAAAGVNVICEKPLAMNLTEADEMIAACDRAGVHLFYAEQLCFAPRYVKVRELVRSGALGRIVQIRHQERHGGPHTAWFHDPEKSGGGVLLDMGCHGVALIRWLLDRPAIASVHAHLGIHKHHGGTVDDHAVVTMVFASGTVGVLDASWAAPGGVDERLEILGTHGSVIADLARGQALLVYSELGVGYAAEKVEHTVGWSFVGHEEARTWGWMGEMEHFVRCVEDGTAGEQTGSDGRSALEIVMAAYQSAADQATVSFPFTTAATRPIDPWLASRKQFGHPA